jgi:hypothetical protein
MVRFVVVFLALLFIIPMIYLTVADFAENGVTGLGVVGAIVVGIVTIGTVGAFLQPQRRPGGRDPREHPHRARGDDDQR